MFETLGQYKILERIGAGGMGEVYRARDARLGRTVAIKVLSDSVAGDPDRRERFMREARAAAALSHPNIAALYEVGEDQGQLFLAFEFVPGETLRAAIAGRPLNPRRAIDLAIQIADALADAHAAGIVHRDLKPDNIIVTPKGNAKILDFGLAAWTAGGAERTQAADAATAIVTKVGTTLGTIAYMSPEQTLGEHVDHRTDIFSLGIVLFEMLTGKLPFNGTTATAVALQIVQTPAPAPSSINRDLPAAVDDIVLRALAKGLDERYQDTVTLAAELRAVAAILDARTMQAAAANPRVAATRPVSVQRSSRRRGRWWALALVLVVAAVGGAAWFERVSLERAWTRAAGPARSPVIAVIPLDSDPAQTFFADGLAEDLITRLGQTPGLKVIGRSATRSYRGRSPQDVAREVGAAVLLTGSVRPAGDTVRISLELIDPSDGTAVWTDQFTRDVKDIFAVQAEVAGHVAQALQVKLQPTASSARAASRLVDPRAYELYLRGRNAVAERRFADAVTFFQQATDVDAGLAEAHAGLAEALFMQARFSQTRGMAPRIQTEVEAAFRADPDLPAAHEAAALLESRRSGIAKGLDQLRAAIAADPSDATAYHAVGDLVQLLLPERAISFYRASLALDPHLDASRGDIVRSLLLLRRRDAAAAEAASMASDPVGARIMLAEYDLLETGRDTLPPDTHPEPGALYGVWIRYARALKNVRQDGAAQEMLRIVLRAAPGACEADALSGRRPSPATPPDPLAPTLACGIVAAAASGDAANAAKLLERLADRADSQIDDVSLSGDLTQFDRARSWYPWSRVQADGRVQAAVKQVTDALDRLRRELPAQLPPLPGPG